MKIQNDINAMCEQWHSKIRIEWPQEGDRFNDQKHTRKNESGLMIESVISAYIYKLRSDGGQDCLCTATVTTTR